MVHISSDYPYPPESLKAVHLRPSDDMQPIMGLTGKAENALLGPTLVDVY